MKYVFSQIRRQCKHYREYFYMTFVNIVHSNNKTYLDSNIDIILGKTVGEVFYPQGAFSPTLLYPIFFLQFSSLLDFQVSDLCVMCIFVYIRVFGTSMVEEYDEIADSQYTSERTEYLDEDYGEIIFLKT